MQVMRKSLRDTLFTYLSYYCKFCYQYKSLGKVRNNLQYPISYVLNNYQFLSILNKQQHQRHSKVIYTVYKYTLSID